MSVVAQCSKPIGHFTSALDHDIVTVILTVTVTVIVLVIVIVIVWCAGRLQLQGGL